jgi:hypothetical protein
MRAAVLAITKSRYAHKALPRVMHTQRGAFLCATRENEGDDRG